MTNAGMHNPEPPLDRGMSSPPVPAEGIREHIDPAFLVPGHPFAFRDGEGLPLGFRDRFFERRYRDNSEVDFDALDKQGKIAFLSKAVHIDEIYILHENYPDLPAGQYRIRNAGSERPFVTLKRHGDGNERVSETIDMVDPADSTLQILRSEGELLAVIEKYRLTYQSKLRPQCLLHSDYVPSLGRFYDVKADKQEHLAAFLSDIGLSAAVPLTQSYLQMKQAKGISSVQLSVWQFQQKFSDYILGVVSGTLTPLGFLTTAIAGGGAKPAMIVALLTAGFCDGLSDSVAAGQATQSSSNSKWFEQLSMFFKTMAGKVVIPCTFMPIVVLANGALSTAIYSSLWAGTLLAATATVQSVAHERRVLPAVGRLLAFGGTAVGVGALIGKGVLPILEKLF